VISPGWSLNLGGILFMSTCNHICNLYLHLCSTRCFCNLKSGFDLNYTKYVSYGINCHNGSFLDDTTYELMNKQTNIIMDDAWIHSLAQTLPSLVINFWWNIIIYDWNLNEKSLHKWQFLQHCKSIIPPQLIYKDWQIKFS